MATSRSVDRLTYVYYTGPDGSEANGPNCHNCMNDMFLEGKLYDVQMVFINTPNGLVPVTTRFLIFFHGMASPFSLSSFAEDILVTRCVQCAEKAIRLQMSEAGKQANNQVTVGNVQQIIKTECVPEAISVMCATPTPESIPPTLTHEDTTAEFSDQIMVPMELQRNTEALRNKNERFTPSPRLRSPHPEPRSRSPDRNRSHPSEHRSGSRSRRHRNRSLDRERSCSRERKKDIERHRKRRKRSRSRGRDSRTDRRSSSRDGKRLKECNDVNDLPFLYGRYPEEVQDPIANKSPEDWIFSIAKRNFGTKAMVSYIRTLAQFYFVEQDVVICSHCDVIFSYHHGTSLLCHLLGKGHRRKVYAAGLVFSHSKDFEKLVEFSKTERRVAPSKPARIPFVFESRSVSTGISLERLASYLSYLMRSKLITDDFSDYLLRIYPMLKGIDNCSLCELALPSDQGADGYLKHFLSSTHIAKAKANKWNLDSDCCKFVGHVYTYFTRDGLNGEKILLDLQRLGV